MRRIWAAHAVAGGRAVELRPNSRIGIELDGMPWGQVPHLTSSGPEDRHSVVGPGSEGVTLVEFGDGVHG